MTTTADTVLRYLDSLPELQLKREGNGWKLNSPLRPGSNSHAFSLTLAQDGEHGAFYDHADGGRSVEKGTLYQLAKLLNIPLPEQSPAVDTKRTYTGLADYAQAHGVPVEVFGGAGWTEGHAVDRRPCLQFMVNGQKRWRFIDGQKPTFKSQPGFKACWYGLERAVTLAKKHDMSALVLCNGEPSVVAAQYHGVPAFAESGGEKSLRPSSLKELREKWQGAVWIALDCDGKGKATAQKIAQQLPGSVIVDLKLGKGGDLSDFCGLHGDGAYEELARRIGAISATNASETPVLADIPKARTSRDIAQHAVTHYADTMTGKPLLVPFRQFHAFGGFARFLMPKKISAFIAMSGHGKTSFLETWTDFFLQAGEGGVWYGSEWDDMEYHWRRVHRMSGVSYERLMSQELYKWEVDNGVVSGHGEALTPDEETRYLAASETITGWRGQVQYFPAERYIEDILTHMSDELAVRRAQGESVTFAVIDYMQLLNVQDAGNGNVPELALGLIKTWTEQNNLHTLIGSQVTKSSAAAGRDNKILNTSDAHYLREDKANLFVSLNHIYEEDTNAPRNPDGSTPRIMTNRAIASILKNNAGRKGNVHLYTDFPRLRWLDKGWTAHRASLVESEAHYADEA